MEKIAFASILMTHAMMATMIGGYMGEDWVFYCSYDGALCAEMMGGIHSADSELGFVQEIEVDEQSQTD